MSTKRFLLQKILQLFLTLFLVTAITFILMKLSPIDAAEAYARRVFTVDNSRIELIREEMGLNRPLVVQYLDWLGIPHCRNSRKGNRLRCSAGDCPSGRWGFDFRHSALPGPQKFCRESVGFHIHRGNFHPGLLSGNLVH